MTTLGPPDVSFDGAPGPVMEGATFGIRALARVIDTIMGLVVGLATGILAGLLIAIGSIVRGVPPDEALAALSETGPLGVIASIVGSIAMHTTSEGLHGSTIGKRLCGLIVVSEGGAPTTVAGALKRSVAYLWDALFFGLIAKAKMDQSPLRQRHGDVWGGTQVVRLSALPPGERPSWIRFAGAALLGMALYSTILFIELAFRLL